MSYSVHKLRSFIDDRDGVLKASHEVAKQFFMAEDDLEYDEMRSLFDNFVLYDSYWGVARGGLGATAVRMEEGNRLRLTWNGLAQPVTSHTFVRYGYVDVARRGFVSYVPVIGPFLSKMTQRPVEEWIVVRNGKVAYRNLDYSWSPSYN